MMHEYLIKSFFSKQGCIECKSTMRLTFCGQFPLTSLACYQKQISKTSMTPASYSIGPLISMKHYYKKKKPPQFISVLTFNTIRPLISPYHSVKTQILKHFIKTETNLNILKWKMGSFHYGEGGGAGGEEASCSWCLFLVFLLVPFKNMYVCLYMFSKGSMKTTNDVLKNKWISRPSFSPWKVWYDSFVGFLWCFVLVHFLDFYFFSSPWELTNSSKKFNLQCR